MSMNNPLYGCESQTAPGGLGCVERIEYPGLNLLAHSTTGIPNLQTDERCLLRHRAAGEIGTHARLGEADMDDSSLAAQSFRRIGEQIHDYLADLRRIPPDGWQIGRQIRFQ